MKTVLYSTDFEPITVIDLPVWLLEKLEKDGGAKLAVQKPLNIETIRELPDPSQLPYDILNLYCDKLRWRDGHIKTIVITQDEELALALKPEWLPGQQQAVNWYKTNLQDAVDMIFKNRKKP